MSPRVLRFGSALAALAAAALVASCTSSVSGHGNSGQVDTNPGSSTAAASANALRYGYGPQKNGAVSYQPDVVKIMFAAREAAGRVIKVDPKWCGRT